MYVHFASCVYGGFYLDHSHEVHGGLYLFSFGCATTLSSRSNSVLNVTWTYNEHVLVKWRVKSNGERLLIEVFTDNVFNKRLLKSSTILFHTLLERSLLKSHFLIGCHTSNHQYGYHIGRLFDWQIDISGLNLNCWI